MTLPPNVAPAAANLADYLVRGGESGWISTDPEGLSEIKPLWANGESGEWALLLRWKKGYVAPPHKHLGGVHVYVIAGSLRVRDCVMHAGDYMYEPNGMVHDVTEALTDCLHINIANGPVLFFDGGGITRYVSWEQMAGLLGR